MNKYTVITHNNEAGHLWTIVEAKALKDAWKQYLKYMATAFEMDEEEVEDTDELVAILEGEQVRYGSDGKLYNNDLVDVSGEED